MKKIFLLATATLALLSFSSCKSQKMLSEATSVADPAAEVTEVAPIQYTAAKKEATPVVTPTPVAQANDRTEQVVVVDAGDSGKLKDFNVIVGSFGTKSNAEAQKSKMVGRGYNAFLVQNPSGMYRVVAGSFDTREAATAVRDIIRSTYASEQGTCAEAWLLIPIK
ncbi:MAG: SPOR domain-containing protein [Bacteroidales bacterium]|nr:SPOR domain-containing protein [Bacteroidales bacterium]